MIRMLFGCRCRTSASSRVSSAAASAARGSSGGRGCSGRRYVSQKTRHHSAAGLTRAQLFTLVGRRQETVQDLGLDSAPTAVSRASNITRSRKPQPTPIIRIPPPSIRASCMPARMSRRRTVSSDTNEPQPVPMRAPGTRRERLQLKIRIRRSGRAAGDRPAELRMRNFADHDRDPGRP